MQRGRAGQRGAGGEGGEASTHQSQDIWMDPEGHLLAFGDLITLFSESLRSPLGLIPWDCCGAQILCPLLLSGD